MSMYGYEDFALRGKRYCTYIQGFRIIKFSEERVFKKTKDMLYCSSGGRNDITRIIRRDKRRKNRKM